MRKHLLLIVSMILISSGCLADEPRLRPDTWAKPVLSDNLKNWYKVDDLVYRSRQPDAVAMVELEKFGIRRVLNLREFHDDQDEAKGTGLKLSHVPINASVLNDGHVLSSLKTIMASDQPILVHCWHGSDRTGAIVAIYRIVVQGWSKAAAIDELRHGGYGFHPMFKNIVEYLENVDTENIRLQLSTIN